MSPSEIRTRLAQNGYPAIPCNGKVPVLPKWQERTETSERDIDSWARTCPDAQNTGVVTTSVPALDLDILDETAVDAAVALVQECFGERGKVMLRYGRRPKVAILFRADETFPKITVPLTAADGSAGQKIEFLGHGQQIIVDGIHPDTHEPYQWRDGNPDSVKRDELPLITEAEAQALVNDVVALSLSHGYQVADEGKRKGNGADHDDTRVDWGYLYENIRTGRNYHESLRDLSCSLVKARTDPGAVVNILRDLMEQSEAPQDKRWKDRYREIPKLVDSAVRLQRKKARQEQDAPIPETDGARVLSAALAYQKRFVCYPSEHAAAAHVLWNAHAHMMDAWESTPRLAFLSAEPTSGKTRSLEISEPMVPNAVSTVNASVAYLFRKAGSDEGQPTVFFDEIDTIFGPKAKDHEDIRGFINAGHRRGATYGRCVVHGTIVMTEDTPVYAAVAVAGLGWLPDTLLARSIIIRMRRRLRTETIEPYRRRDHAPQAKEIGRRLAGWASTVIDAAKGMRPAMPAGVEDRAADCWEPLLVVADLAGGEWPTLAREAAVAFVTSSQNQTPVSLYLRLLGDIRTVFWKNLTQVAQSQPKGLPTKRILEELYTLDDAPWGTLNKGEAYTPTQLATCLFEYGAKSDYLRPHPSQPHLKARGYRLRDLADAWRRYLGPLFLSRNSVAAVAGVARETFDQFFEWAEEPEEAEESDPPVTPATSATPYSEGERDQETEATEPPVTPSGEELEEKLDTARVEALAKWWRGRVKQLVELEDLSPVLAADEARKGLHEMLAEQLLESALDTEVDRVVAEAERKDVPNFAHILTRQLKDED
jgi:hypothetical protein